MQESEYLSPEEVGVRFKASKWTVRRWIEAGKVPATRVGRRWLVPKEAVERMQEMGIHPAKIRYVISRGPAPIYTSFDLPLTETEVDRLATAVVSVLHAGGLPGDNPEVRKDAVRKIIRGQERVPPAFWRILADGILAIRTKD